MRTTTVTIIGGGQAGLAMSQCLTGRSIDHVVLERSEVANSWRTERWDSLRLLTPNWLTRLPGWDYQGSDPDGFMRACDVVDHLAAYARAFDAPVETGVTVTSVEPGDTGHLVRTDQGPVRSQAVVVASGAASTPKIPGLSEQVPSHIRQIAPIHYRSPAQVDGPVLVVGASASGAQLADELARAGREVTLAVGEHTRLPRTYRGMDIHWWMDGLGLLDDRYDEVEDVARARRLPSLQLVGGPDRRTLDLNALQASGVDLVGRLVGISGGNAQFSGSLANIAASADLKQGRLLDEIDRYAHARGLDAELGPIDRPVPTGLPVPRNTAPIDHFRTIIWATGFRPHYPWLAPSLLDRKGAIEHDGGVMSAPGMYVLGLPFGRRRKSSFLDGVGPDALETTDHLVRHLAHAGTPIR